MLPMTPIAVEVALEVAAELLAASLASAKLRCGVLLLVVILEGQSHSECFLQLPPEKQRGTSLGAWRRRRRIQRGSDAWRRRQRACLRRRLSGLGSTSERAGLKGAELGRMELGLLVGPASGLLKSQLHIFVIFCQGAL